MNWRIWGCGVLSLVAGLLGCFPEKRVVWSPDGRWAAVLGSDGLYLCGPDGTLSPQAAAGVKRVAWLPDSRRLVLARVEKVKSWTQMLPFLDGEQRERVKAAAEKVRTQVLAYEGDLEAFEPDGLEALSDGEKGAVLLYLRDERNEGLPEKAGEKWQQLQEAELDAWSLQLAELSDGEVRPGSVLVRSVNEIRQPCVAPDGQAVAFVQPGSGGEQSESLALLVVPTDGGAPPRVVAERVCWSPDWSGDGRYLVYAYSEAGTGNKLRLGAVARRAVRDEAGRLLADFPEAEVLAGTLFENEVGVRCLKDGRILFSSIEVQLPCTADDMPQHGTLFALHPGRSPLVARLIPRSAQADAADWMYFDVSPDGQRVCHADASGQVSILTLATGKSWTIVGEDDAGGKLSMVPAWRSADELCCAVAAADGSERAAVALFKLNWAEQSATRTVLSAAWPDAVVRGFLLPEEKPEEKKDGPG